MSVTPKCPHCESTDQPKTVRKELEGATALILYCASCGSILAAADVQPQYAASGLPSSHN
jgi:uncharacterized Zn finger protein